MKIRHQMECFPHQMSDELLGDDDKARDRTRTLTRRLRDTGEVSAPCYDLIALSAAQWDVSEDGDQVEPSLQPVKKRPRPKPKKSPKIELSKERVTNRATNASMDSSTGSQRGRNPTGDRPRWWIQSFLLLLALRQAGRPLSRRVLIPRALELEKKIAKQRGLPLIFGGKVGLVLVFVWSVAHASRSIEIDAGKYSISNSD